LHEFQTALEAIQAPSDTSVQVTYDFTEFKEEYRILIVNHEAIGVSRYLPEDIEGSTPATSERLEAAQEFAREVATEMRSYSPRAYTMDVGSDAIDEFVVVEVNNAWSSNPYDINSYAFCIALDVASDWRATDERHWYKPDPLDVFFASKKPQLHATVPITISTEKW
jgi:hypothetical protein